MPRLVPALCCAALAIACVSAFAPRLSGTAADAAATPMPVSIDSIAAGGEQAAPMTRMADVSGTARVRAVGGGSESLFASASGDIPLVAVNGAVYRMLSTPANVRGDLLGSAVGTVNTATDEPALADDDAMAGGLSNVAEAGQTIYAVSGLDANTAVACKVGGNMRLFQRVSYAGKGPGGLGLEDTFSIRGQVAELTLSGVGTLTGEAANDAVATLLDHATLKSADSSARKQTLTVTLTNGLKLQLGVSGDTVSACGGWSCPEFFEAGRFCRLRFFLGFEACLLFLPLRPALLADRLGAAFEGFAVRAAVSLPSVGDLVDPGFIFLLIEAAFSVGTTCHAINLQFL